MTPISITRHSPYECIAQFADGYSCRYDETAGQEWQPFCGDLRLNAVVIAHLERRSNGAWYVAPATSGRFAGKTTWRPVDMQLLDVPTSAGIVEAAEAAIGLLKAELQATT